MPRMLFLILTLLVHDPALEDTVAGLGAANQTACESFAMQDAHASATVTEDHAAKSVNQLVNIL